MIIESEKLRLYLLGGLSDDEVASIDSMIIDDDSIDDAIDLCEDALIDDYLRERLTEEEGQLFRENYLVCDERVHKIQKIRDLMTVSERRDTADTPPIATLKHSPSPSWWTWMAPYAFGAATIAIVAGVLSIWYTDRDVPAITLDAEYARISIEGINDFGQFPNAARLELAPGLTRSGRLASVVAGPTGDVLISLGLPNDAEQAGVYAVSISQINSGPIEVTGLRPISNGAGGEIRLLLPASILNVGQNEISLTKHDRGVISKYYFNFSPSGQ